VVIAGHFCPLFSLANSIKLAFLLIIEQTDTKRLVVEKKI